MSGPNIVFAANTAQQVYDWLRDRILRGELLPGARLSETEVSKQIGVSRQPVREAFIRLAMNGLAEIRPQRGTYIRTISESTVPSARTIREAVEADMVRLLAARITADDLTRLDEELDQQRRAAEAQDAEGFMALDDRFHRYLVAAAGHEHVWDVLEGLKSDMNRVRHLSARTFTQQKLIEQHSQIVEALREQDADRAEQAMRQHLKEILTDLPDVMRAHPGFFGV